MFERARQAEAAAGRRIGDRDTSLSDLELKSSERSMADAKVCHLTLSKRVLCWNYDKVSFNAVQFVDRYRHRAIYCPGYLSGETVPTIITQEGHHEPMDKEPDTSEVLRLSIPGRGSAECIC